MKTKTPISFFSGLMAAACFMITQQGAAQIWSASGQGTPHDRWTINHDNSNHWAHLRLQAGNNKGWNMYNEGSLNWSYSTSSSHGERGSIKMRLTTDGKLGIGTHHPQARLDVAGAIKYTGDETGTVLYGDGNESGSPAYDSFRIRYDRDFFDYRYDALIFEKTDANDINPDGGIAFVNTGFDGVAEPALVIRGSNNVGLGTTNPKAKLHVAGDIYTRGHLYLYSFLGDGTDGTAYVQARDDSETSNINLQLRTQNAGQVVNAVRIMNDGNVGIGNTSPDEKLHVTGNIKADGNIEASSVILNIGTFPDYVFENDYPLMPLNKVESYIKAHKHLPGFPSEAEVVKSGANLGELNKLLVEKVEELTLYTIAQQKQIDMLLEALKKQTDNPVKQ